MRSRITHIAVAANLPFARPIDTLLLLLFEIKGRFYRILRSIWIFYRQIHITCVNTPICDWRRHLKAVGVL